MSKPNLSNPVCEWVEANLERKMREFGVPHWRIEVEYDYDEPAQIEYDHTRERATLRLNTSYFTGREEEFLEAVVEHELLHLAIAPFAQMLRTAAPFLEDAASESLDAAYDISQEMAVRNLERLVFSLREAARPGAGE